MTETFQTIIKQLEEEIKELQNVRFTLGERAVLKAKLKTAKQLKELVEKAIDNILLERLSDLEHQQWIHWTKYMMKSIHDEEKFIKWEKQTKIPYIELDEEDKEKDRKWARIVLEELRKSILGGNK